MNQGIIIYKKMFMPKLVSLLCYFIFVSILSSSAQQPKIRFDSLAIDFGQSRLASLSKGNFNLAIPATVH